MAEEVSSAEIQQLWGRILVGEVRKPGSVSLRTLEVLRNMSRTEAELFCRFAKLAIDASGRSEPMVINPPKFLEDIYGFSFTDRLALKEIGIIHQSDLSWTLDAKAAGTQWFEHAGHAIVMRWEQPLGKIKLPVFVFTKTGRELLPLITANFEKAYIEKFCSLLKPPTCTFRHGPIIERMGESVKVDQLLPLLEEPQDSAAGGKELGSPDPGSTGNG